LKVVKVEKFSKELCVPDPDWMVGKHEVERRIGYRGRYRLPESNRLLQLQSDLVVHRVPEALLAAQVSFSCLHGDVP
jgi:hypothetical protein